MGRKDTARAYDRLAPRYDVRWRRYVGETLEQTLRCLEGPAPTRALDVGCGTGEFLRHVRNRYPEVELVGVDPAAGMLEAACRKLGSDPRVRFQCASVEALPFHDGEFDWVTCVSVLHCVRDACAALGEMARVLRPGGRLVVVDWCRETWWSRGFNRWHCWTDPAHVWMYTTAELRRMAEFHGLRVMPMDRFRVSGPGPLRVWEMMACVSEKP